MTGRGLAKVAARSFCFACGRYVCVCDHKQPGNLVELEQDILFDVRTHEEFWPALVRRVAAFRVATDVGVGDTLERLFAKFGGRQFKWMMAAAGVVCGCDDRQRFLNNRYPYASRAG